MTPIDLLWIALAFLIGVAGLIILFAGVVFIIAASTALRGTKQHHFKKGGPFND